MQIQLRLGYDCFYAISAEIEKSLGVGGPCSFDHALFVIGTLQRSRKDAEFASEYKVCP